MKTAVECIISLEKNDIKNKLEIQRNELREIEIQGLDKSQILKNILELRKNLDHLNLKKKDFIEEIK